MTLYYLQHTMRYGHSESRKGIGLYTSRAAAEAARARVSDKPGFRDLRGDFQIYACELGFLYLPDGLDRPSRHAHRVGADDKVSEPEDAVHLLYDINLVDAEEYDDDFRLLGYFASEAAAEAARDQLLSSQAVPLVGRKFEISQCFLNRDNWVDGFVSSA